MAALTCALCTAACLDAEEVVPSPEALPDDAIVYDTVATLSPDGTLVMSPPRPITVAEQRAQNVQRIHRVEPTVAATGYGVIGIAPGEDYECLATSFWLYARTDYTGDRICFQGNAFFHMADYSRFVMVNGHPYYGTWKISSGSYLAGERSGSLWSWNPATGTYTTRTFDPYYAFYGTFQFSNPLTEIYQ